MNTQPPAFPVILKELGIALCAWIAVIAPFLAWFLMASFSTIDCDTCSASRATAGIGLGVGIWLGVLVAAVLLSKRLRHVRAGAAFVLATLAVYAVIHFWELSRLQSGHLAGDSIFPALIIFPAVLVGLTWLSFVRFGPAVLGLVAIPVFWFSGYSFLHRADVESSSQQRTRSASVFVHINFSPYAPAASSGWAVKHVSVVTVEYDPRDLRVSASNQSIGSSIVLLETARVPDVWNATLASASLAAPVLSPKGRPVYVTRAPADPKSPLYPEAMTKIGETYIIMTDGSGLAHNIAYFTALADTLMQITKADLDNY